MPRRCLRGGDPTEEQPVDRRGHRDRAAGRGVQADPDPERHDPARDCAGEQTDRRHRDLARSGHEHQRPKTMIPASTALSRTGISTRQTAHAARVQVGNLQRHVGTQRRATDHGLPGTEVVQQPDHLLAERRHGVEQRVVGSVRAAVPEQVDGDHVRPRAGQLARQGLVHPARHQLAVHEHHPALPSAVLGVLDAVTVVEVLVDAFGDERHEPQFPTTPSGTTPCPNGCI